MSSPFEDFKNGFIACAMCLGQHFADESEAETGEGTDLQDMFEPSDIPADIMREIETDCRSFYDAHAHLWADNSDEQAGYDFFLTRNRHGVGFWDGDYEHGDELTEASRPYGSFNLEAFADGPIYS